LHANNEKRKKKKEKEKKANVPVNVRAMLLETWLESG